MHGSRSGPSASRGARSIISDSGIGSRVSFRRMASEPRSASEPAVEPSEQMPGISEHQPNSANIFITSFADREAREPSGARAELLGDRGAPPAAVARHEEQEGPSSAASPLGGRLRPDSETLMHSKDHDQQHRITPRSRHHLQRLDHIVNPIRLISLEQRGHLAHHRCSH